MKTNFVHNVALCRTLRFRWPSKHTLRAQRVSRSERHTSEPEPREQTEDEANLAAASVSMAMGHVHTRSHIALHTESDVMSPDQETCHRHCCHDL